MKSREHKRLKSCRGHAVELLHGRNVEASNACGRMLAPIDKSPSFIRQRYVGVLTIVSRGGYGPRGSGQRTGIKRSGPASHAPSFPLPALELTKAGDWAPLAALCNIGLDPPELCKAQLLLTYCACSCPVAVSLFCVALNILNLSHALFGLIPLELLCMLLSCMDKYC